MDLNFLIIHNRLPLGEWLARKNISPNDKCRLCGETTETCEHLFLECSVTIQTRLEMTELVKQVDDDVSSPLTRSEIIYHLGQIKNSNKTVHEIVSQFKFSIWQTRAKMLTEGVTNPATALLYIFRSRLKAQARIDNECMSL